MSIKFHSVERDPDASSKIFTKFYKSHLRTIMTYKEEDDKLNNEINRLNEGLKRFELDLYKKNKSLPIADKKLFKIDYKTKCLKSNSKYCADSLDNIRVKLKNLEESINSQKIKCKNEISEFQSLENTIDSQLKTIENNIQHIIAARSDVEISHRATVESCYQAEAFAKQCFSRYMDVWPKVQMWLSFEASNITAINGTSTLEGIIGEWTFYRSIASYFQDMNESFDPFNSKNKGSKGVDAYYTKQQPLDKLKLFLQNRHKNIQHLCAIITAQVMKLDVIRKAHKTMLLDLQLALEEDFSFSCLQCENEATSPLGYALAMKAKVIAKQLEKLKQAGVPVSAINVESSTFHHNITNNTSIISSVTGNPIYVVNEPEPQETRFHTSMTSQTPMGVGAPGVGKIEGLTDFESSLLSNKEFFDSLLDPSANNVELTHPKFSYPLCKNSKLMVDKWYKKVRLSEDFLSKVGESITDERRYERLPKLYKFVPSENSEDLKLDRYIHSRKQLVMRAAIELQTLMSHISLMALNIADINLDKVMLSLEKLNAIPTEATAIKITDTAGVSQEAVSVVLDASQVGSMTLPPVSNISDSNAANESQVDGEGDGDNDPYKVAKQAFANMEAYYAEKESKSNVRIKMRKFLVKDWFAYNELSLQAALTARCPHFASEEVYRDRCVKAIRVLKNRYLSARKKPAENLAVVASQEKKPAKVAMSSVKSQSIHDIAIMMEKNPENFELDIYDESGMSVAEVAAMVDNGRLLFQSTCRISGELLNISLFWQSEFERIKLEARSVIKGKIEVYVMLLTRGDIAEIFAGIPLTEADIMSKSNTAEQKDKNGHSVSFGSRLMAMLRMEMISTTVAYGLTKKSRTIGNKVAFKSIPTLTESSESTEIKNVRLLTVRNKDGDVVSCCFGKEVAKASNQ